MTKKITESQKNHIVDVYLRKASFIFGDRSCNSFAVVCDYSSTASFPGKAGVSFRRGSCLVEIKRDETIGSEWGMWVCCWREQEAVLWK